MKREVIKKWIFRLAIFLPYLLFCLACLAKYSPEFIDFFLASLINRGGNEFYFMRIRNAFLFLMIFLIVTPLQSYLIYVLAKYKKYEMLRKVAAVSLFSFIALALIAYSMTGVFPVFIPTVDN